MCFIPMNVHNELVYGVRQLRWQHVSLVVSTFSTSIAFILLFHKALHPPSLPLSVQLSLSLSVVPHPVFLILVIPCGLEMLMCSSCNPMFFAVRHIHYPANRPFSHWCSSPTYSDHCRTETVLPTSDHYWIKTVAPSGDCALMHWDINAT